MATNDPFAVLGLPRTYALDRAEVEKRYLERVAAMHPDLIGAEAMGALGEDGLDTERQSSELNEARRTLDDPEKRAVALWKLLGGIEDSVLPGGFLAEMMEVRESIEDAKTPEDRAKWESWVQERRNEYEKRVRTLFDSAGPDPIPESLRAIKMELNAWRYIERLAEQL